MPCTINFITIATILAPHKQYHRYLIEAMLQHNHNHDIKVADRQTRTLPIVPTSNMKLNLMLYVDFIVNIMK